MLFAGITVSLPRKVVEHRRSELRAWFRALVGQTKADASAPQPRVATIALFRAVIDAFTAAGIDDVIHIFVDGEPSYMDVLGVQEDLSSAFADTMVRVSDTGDFSEVRIVCAHREGGLKLLFDTRIDPRAGDGHERVQMRIAARIEELFISRGESAVEFSDRVRAYVTRPGTLEQSLERVAEVASRLAAAFRVAIPSGEVVEAPAEVRLIRTGTIQVGRFRNLGFRERVRAPTYRATPTHQRSGAYDSPFYYYYFDPYHDLVEWIVIDEIVHGRAWSSDRVSVVDRAGALLFRGDQATNHADDEFEVPTSAVGWSPRGDLVVDPSVPQASSLDPIEVGSPHAPGYGGGGGG